MLKKKAFSWLWLLLFFWPALLSSELSQESLLVFVSPARLLPEKIFRVMLVSEEKLSGEIRVCWRDNQGKRQALKLHKKGGGPPFWQWWQGSTESSGLYSLEVVEGHKALFSREVEVFSSPRKPEPPAVFWKTEKDWNRNEENLFSSWLEALFQEAEEKDSWSGLHPLLRDPEKNFLYDHLGLGEEESGLRLEPDCADNPFFLRAYFSWKNRLPFGFHECSRGSLGRPPAVGRWFSNELPSGEGDEVKKFYRLLQRVMDTVHSGTARTSLNDDLSDYYPLPLSRDCLRPGSVFADPYGHTLVIVRWVPQTENSAGILLAVDAQPDGTIGIKRFWKGNFLFATEEVVGEPGFKAFRPIVRKGGHLTLLTNQDIKNSPDYGNLSLEQKGLQPELFYQKMETLINPQPLDPENALRQIYQALYEQLLVRVESVEIGEKYRREHPGQIIPMPSGYAVFLATGPWEDFSTPNRDLRLLIAMDTIEEFPENVIKFPKRYRIGTSEPLPKIKSRLEALSRSLADSLYINYRKSDGRSQKLTIRELLERKEAFEMAYNPNDCVEIRWGAPEGSEELSSCRRRAPLDQRQKMEKLRVWFRKRLHPPT